MLRNVDGVLDFFVSLPFEKSLWKDNVRNMSRLEGKPRSYLGLPKTLSRQQKDKKDKPTWTS